MEYDSSNFFVKTKIDGIYFNLIWLDIQETKFGAKFHIFGNIINDMTTQFLHISTPAHLSKFNLNRNQLAATQYDDDGKTDNSMKTTTINLAGGYTYQGVLCIPLDMYNEDN